MDSEEKCVYAATKGANMWDLKRELLIPITIDVQVQGLRVLDTLLWDVAGQQQVCARNF